MKDNTLLAVIFSLMFVGFALVQMPKEAQEAPERDQWREGDTIAWDIHQWPEDAIEWGVEVRDFYPTYDHLDLGADPDGDRWSTGWELYMTGTDPLVTNYIYKGSADRIDSTSYLPMQYYNYSHRTYPDLRNNLVADSSSEHDWHDHDWDVVWEDGTPYLLFSSGSAIKGDTMLGWPYVKRDTSLEKELGGNVDCYDLMGEGGVTICR